MARRGGRREEWREEEVFTDMNTEERGTGPAGGRGEGRQGTTRRGTTTNNNMGNFGTILPGVI